jgi:hypothetical protein
VLLVVSSLVTFGRIAGNDFINFDDTDYITENNHIKAGFNKENIKWAATAVVSSNWHPLTLLSHMLDWSLFGANASGHHLVSLFLHIGAVIFLFLFLNKTTNNIWPSAFAAALFALHPLRVESVAWVSERKDVLSMFFGMACLYSYAFWAQKEKLFQYFLCLILFVGALMSKPMMVTLPFVLLLLDYWPLNRWPKAFDGQGKSVNSVGKLIGEKIPFICLTIASCIITLWAQNEGTSIASIEKLPFLERTANASISYVAYLEKTLWPVNLAVFYPYDLLISPWTALIDCIILILITFIVLYHIKKLPFLFVGWFWYLGTLVPVIGIVQVGRQMMADRYTYLPAIGITIIIAWIVLSMTKNEFIRKKILLPVGIVSLIILGILTWQQCGYWKNSISLFNHTLHVTKNNALAHCNYAAALREDGQIDKAFYHFNKVILLKPEDADAYNNRGTIYSLKYKYQFAINDYNKAINLKNNHINAYNNRGIAYTHLGRYELALEDFSKAIFFNPDFADAYSNRTFIYYKQGNKVSCCNDAKKACELGKCENWKALLSEGFCR